MTGKRVFVRSGAAQLGVGAALIAGFALGMLATTAQPSAAVPTADAAAPEACSPGAVARIPGPPPVLEALNAAPGTLPYTGKGVLVAVVDSGVDGTRPQLASALAPGSRSLVSDDARPDGLGDPFGHGTAVAGIIAARPESGSGVTGIAPDAQLVSIRVFSSTDEQAKRAGTGPDAERLAAGIRDATDLGAKIIVVAMSDDLDTAALRAATQDAYARGSLVVASAGNRSTTEVTTDSPRYPAAYPGALAVTAVTLSGRPTDDSIHGSHVDVAAPGQNVLTTATGAGDCVYAGDAPSSSFSTAYAAGAAALLAEAYPNEGPEGWMYRLQATADRPNPDGRDDLIGWGRISPAAALSLRPDRTTRGPASPFADTSGSAVARPHTQIARSETAEPNPAPAIIGAAALGGLIIVLALVAQLRRRRAAAANPQSETAAGDAGAAGTQETSDEDDDDPYGPR
ncbi:S8 family serine peptidase [Leucobacter komagatae]|uniref:S8 family serine peptidase n=1 Tax=Leucobacter komagatae TaxID=55969 RepID=UPI000696A1DC|nr:S8 family serine peptidase [Leucobacter komagatae]